MAPLASRSGRLRQAHLWRPGSPMACSYVSNFCSNISFLRRPSLPTSSLQSPLVTSLTCTNQASQCGTAVPKEKCRRSVFPQLTVWVPCNLHAMGTLWPSSRRTGVSRTQPVGSTRPHVCFCESALGAHSHPSADMLSVLTFMLHSAATETVQEPAKPKIFNTGPLGESLLTLG